MTAWKRWLSGTPLTTLALALAASLTLTSVRGEGTASAPAATITIDGSTTVGPLAKAFAEYYAEQHPEVKITVAESGSGNGAKSLINSTCDLAAMSRFMKPEEFKAAADKGVMPVAHVICMDGIAVIVHPANPVKGLTMAQVKGIYTGKITNWKDLGGPDAKIVIISRDTNSGTYEAFSEMALHQEKMAGGAEYVGATGAVRQRVQTTEGAIGYIGLGFVDATVKALPVDGVAPTVETVTTGRYPISRPLFLFTNGYPKLGSHVHALVSLYLSPKGQELVNAIGFVPVTAYQK